MLSVPLVEKMGMLTPRATPRHSEGSSGVSVRVVLLLLLLSLSSIFHSSLALSSSPTTPTPTTTTTTGLFNRRTLLNIGAAQTASVILFPTTSQVVLADEGTLSEQKQEQQEAQQEAQPKRGLLSAVETANLLKTVPTFTIVDKTGVPYFVVGEDAKVTSYFFTTYDEAMRILKVAKSSADKSILQSKKEGKLSEEEIGTNPWTNARISSVPLDLAVGLTAKSSVNRRGGTYFQIAPAEKDIEDALRLTGQDNLAEGKVPLFYDEDFMIEMDNGDGSGSTTKKTPLYFRKSDLEEAYKKYGGNKSRKLKPSVTELFSVLAELVKPGGSDADLKSIIFVSPKESEKKKLECEKLGGNEPPFVFGQRIIVL